MFLGERSALGGGEGAGSIMGNVSHELEDMSREPLLLDSRMIEGILDIPPINADPFKEERSCKVRTRRFIVSTR